jgi:RNase H-fold protein (predicted Holliday junction resolvase)
LKGGATEMSARIARFMKKLRKVVDIKVVLWDERYISKYAQNRLKSLGISSRKEDIDRIAASIMLDEYLQAKRA